MRLCANVLMVEDRLGRLMGEGVVDTDDGRIATEDLSA
jgi:hypothetical protein